MRDDRTPPANPKATEERTPAAQGPAGGPAAPQATATRTAPAAPRAGAEQAAAGRPAAATPAAWLIVAGLFLAAFNLRPAVAGLGPLLEEVRDGLGMNGAVAGLLTSLPALCFGLFGMAAPRLARRLGPGTVVAAGMAAIAAGLGLRAASGSTPVFLLFSALALAGIAVSNVLMPVLVKRYFPDRVGAMTGLYSTALALGTSAAAAFTIPLADAGGGWRFGLLFWALTAAAAVPVWSAALLRRRAADRARERPDQRPAAAAPPAAPEAPLRLSRSPTAWSLAVFFGLQSTAAYITMGWAPQIYRDAGVPATTAGLLLALVMGVGAPLGFVLPTLAARMRHQGPLAAGLGACGLVGYAGLWLAPAGGAWAWATLLGIANCCFPVALTMIGLRARTSQGVARLSAFVQGIGYLISLPGPLLVGILNEATGGWEVPLAFTTCLLIAQIAVGLRAGRDRCIEDGD
ncbi:CynX/NimT family MFS transporter [Streptomyces hoynatensis]|uniref:MFS transporter n=1 Tax=Streptomyces hoynatensis TaxID=1141874 RepID=A0A3A9Z2K8_9ACTN|nr:MFS transporter [Streptomyces hoynatensis]RKN42473.1 MFS transporter [Streptomyces hoynatensis]